MTGPAGVPAPAVELRGVRHRFPDGREALRGVDLAVHHGERVAVLGPNGAGKSTLLLHLDGLLAPSSGTVLVDGVPVTRRTMAEVRRRVGLVFQDAEDQLFLPTVGEDVGFGPANLGLGAGAREERVTEALAATGASHLRERHPHQLSAGEKRRAALAGVLAMRPEVLALDEPTADLDPRSRAELVALLGSLGPAVVVATHDLLLALELCPRTIVLVDGEVVADGPTAQLLDDDALLERARLVLPFGFDRRLLDREPAFPADRGSC